MRCSVLATQLIFTQHGRIVESTGARMFGLDDVEVTKRRKYVGHVRKEIEVRLLSSLNVSGTDSLVCKSRI